VLLNKEADRTVLHSHLDMYQFTWGEIKRVLSAIG